jgi:GT2 family glycosyltransferase
VTVAAAGDGGAGGPGRSVCVVMVSYRSGALAVSSLASLARERERVQPRGIAVRAVVVDNASGDADLIRPAIAGEGWGAWVDLVLAERNGGFAYGNNVGFRHAYETGRRPDYFFLLNPDTEVRPGAISALVDFLDSQPTAGMAGSSLEGRDGRVWPYAFRFHSMVGEVLRMLELDVLNRALDHHRVLRRMGDQPEEADWFPGAAMMLRSRVVEELGGLDEAYFLYYEETDFCLKMKRAGWTNWYVPASRVMHIAGQSTGVTGANRAGRRLPAYWFESRRRYFEKNFGPRYAMATDAVAMIAHVLGAAKNRLKRGDARPSHFLRDLWRASALAPGNFNRPLAPPNEYRPPPASSPQAS